MKDDRKSFRWSQENMLKYLNDNVDPTISGKIKWSRFIKQFYKTTGTLYPFLESIEHSPFIDSEKTRKKVHRVISDLWRDISNTQNCKCGHHNYPIFFNHCKTDPTTRILEYTQRIMTMKVNAATKITLHKLVNYFTQIL